MLHRIALVLRALGGRLTQWVCGPRVRALLVQTDTGRFAIDPEDFAIGRRLRWHGTYGTNELAQLGPRLTPACRVLVVGAHIGTLAIPLARVCREVVAVEANPHTFELLQLNIALNGVANCRALPIAASDRVESLPFVLSRVNSGGSKRVPKRKAFRYYYDRPRVIPVPAHPLDTVLPDADFAGVVMDVEGSESHALRGMPTILSRARWLAVEFLPHHLRHVGGVSVAEFLSAIPPHFTRLTIPSTGQTLDRPQFLACLNDMYRRNQGDAGLIFEAAAGEPPQDPAPAGAQTEAPGGEGSEIG